MELSGAGLVLQNNGSKQSHRQRQRQFHFYTPVFERQRVQCRSYAYFEKEIPL
jgi:hypothetical protein